MSLAASDGGYVVADAVRFTPSVDQPSTGGVYYVHSDQLGTPRMITRPSDNQIVWRWDNTEPFGDSQANEDPGGVGAFSYNLRFPGQYRDLETGTNYNYFRDYDATTARYIQSDPIGLYGGKNTYAYVGGNALRFSDPFGLATWSIPAPDFPMPAWLGALGTRALGAIGIALSLGGDTSSQPQSNQTVSECKDDCDAREQREIADCEWKYKLGGRVDREGMRSCMQQARDRWVGCYRWCDHNCKKDKK